MPDTTREREILYITGCSGSGKSTYTRKNYRAIEKKPKKISPSICSQHYLTMKA